MLCVAVVGGDAEEWATLASRVRHTCLESCARAAAADPAWESAAAIAFVGDARPDDASTTAALASGKHLLVATRAAPAVSDLERWTELAGAHRVRLEVVNPDRALPSRRLIRQHIENGKFGDVGLVRISRCASPTVTGGIRAARVSDSIVSDLDLAVWLMGRAPDTVFAVRRRIEKSASPNAECLHVHLGFPQGSSALISVTTAVPSGDSYESLSVIAFSGAAYADDHQNRQLLFSGGPATAPPADEGDALAFLLDEFAVSVQSFAGGTASLDHWRQLAEIADAVEQSAASQQAVSLELD